MLISSNRKISETINRRPLAKFGQRDILNPQLVAESDIKSLKQWPPLNGSLHCLWHSAIATTSGSPLAAKMQILKTMKQGNGRGQDESFCGLLTGAGGGE